MKRLTVIIAAFILVFGIAAARAANLDRISAATGVPVATLQTERSSTGLGWGSLEKAHLLANASGQSFDDIVALHQGGQGWGKIAHDNGLKLGTLVSNAHRSSNGTMHAKNTHTMHGMSGTHVAKGHGAKTSTTRRIGHRSSSFNRSHGMRSMGHMSSSHGKHSTGHMSGSHGMRSMGHSGGHRR
ncbi:MAG: hypothetical protein ACJ8LL_00945 [Candidatus Udaeobacter sp.]